ncbi:MAG TPA: TfoX/Sxy family protein [Dongiaceae bacterium]|nr:TfoX/Sxy family protein [Dongiaceae bacterium]
MAKKPPNPVAADLIAQLDRKLAPLGHIATRRMFSGYGAYLDGVVFALILRGRLWLRVDDATRPDFVKAGMKPFAYTQTRSGKVIRVESYYECPAAVLGDGAKLRRWVKEARRASAERNKKKPAKRKPADGL